MNVYSFDFWLSVLLWPSLAVLLLACFARIHRCARETIALIHFTSALSKQDRALRRFGRERWHAYDLAVKPLDVTSKLWLDPVDVRRAAEREIAAAVPDEPVAATLYSERDDEVRSWGAAFRWMCTEHTGFSHTVFACDDSTGSAVLAVCETCDTMKIFGDQSRAEAAFEQYAEVRRKAAT